MNEWMNEGMDEEMDGWMDERVTCWSIKFIFLIKK